MTYIANYIKNNKKNIFIIFNIISSTVLLVSISIIFSSLREYLITSVKKEIGSYHVILKANVSNYNFILKKQYKNNRYYITYKNIKNVYKNTNQICKQDKCETITYNESLLSLYGVSKNKNTLKILKKILFFIIFILSLIIFFIIYNSFKANINSRKKDINLFKLIGFTDYDLYKLFFKEAAILGILGTVLGILISLLTNFIILKILNKILYEIFKGDLHLNIYLPFLFIPILFITIIITFSSLIELKDIRNYKPLELIRKNNQIENIKTKPFKNIVLWLSYINYNRERKKYRSLTICVFTFVFGLSIFYLILNYGLTCLNKYVIVPEYDVLVNVKGDYNFKKIENDLKPSKKILYKGCYIKTKIQKKHYIKDYKKEETLLVTNIGKNEIINAHDKITNNGKIKREKYQKFKNLSELKLEEQTIKNLKLRKKAPYGFKNLDVTAVNLTEETFNKVCDEYTSTIIMNTNYKGLDSYLDKLIKKEKIEITYINIKKYREIIKNIVLIFKLFMYLTFILITLVMLTVTINITTSNIYGRKKEYESLNSIGLETKNIIKSLFIESLIISIKGWLYSVPFIFIVNKYLYSSIKEVFYFKKIVLGLNIILQNLILSLIIIFLSMLLGYRLIKTESLINNIKCWNK